MRVKQLSIVAALCATIFAGAVQARDFRSADVHPRDYPTVQAVEYMGKLISEKTKGKYGVKVFVNSTLGSEKDVIEQVKIGTLDMSRFSISSFHGIVPETQVPSFPFIFRDNAHFQKVIRGPVGEEILASFEKAGFVGLALYDAGARSVYAKKPVRQPADMKGLKIRVISSDLFVGMIQALGGSPIPIPTAEVYTALRTGLVEAAENNYPTFETARHYEVATYFSETQHTRIPEVVVFSKKVWDTLSAEEQKIIREAARASVDYYQKLWDAKMLASKKILSDAKVTFVEDVDHDAFVALEKPVWDKFSTTPQARELVKKITEVK
ncbi:TRAP transporter substrate-binding protein [Uliginosibacterium sp. H1]|uniref:TRAP transporter substrate-binding protein n=1 Tax=Uliginosibacterium sp. H1 TaxID=3114757 RepID=UPI002E18BC94|nr:TRAP transporter substrate-binding protein [Uliginosibacterium sp. H1]